MWSECGVDAGRMQEAPRMGAVPPLVIPAQAGIHEHGRVRPVCGGVHGSRIKSGVAGIEPGQGRIAGNVYCPVYPKLASPREAAVPDAMVILPVKRSSRRRIVAPCHKGRRARLAGLSAISIWIFSDRRSSVT